MIIDQELRKSYVIDINTDKTIKLFKENIKTQSNEIKLVEKVKPKQKRLEL